MLQCCSFLGLLIRLMNAHMQTKRTNMSTCRNAFMSFRISIVTKTMKAKESIPRVICVVSMLSIEVSSVSM